MSEAASTAIEPNLEILWQEDASAYLLVREPDGTLTSRGLQAGMPAVAELVHAGHGVSARRLELHELLELETRTPLALEPGGTARVVFAVLDVARRSVAAGLVHPHLEAADGRWHALWGATLDEHVVDELQALAHATPAAAADAFDGDTRAFVDDLYACAVDELARRALRDSGVSLTPRPHGPPASPSGSSPVLPRRHPSFRRTPGTPPSNAESPPGSTAVSPAARERRGTSASGWTRWPPCPRDAPPVVLELWLEAADDPTLALPAALLETGADEVFGFLRDSDPRRALDRRLETIEPVLADAGIALEGDPPTQVALDADQVRAFLRDAMPRLEALGVPLRLPRDWVSSSSRVRVNLVATGSTAVSSGLLTRDAIASFDWRVAIGDVELSEEELRELAAAKEPLIRLRGKWHALRASEVERALRFLERRGRSAGVIELVRAVSGLETDEAGVELGEVRLDATLDDLLAGADERRFRPRATPAGMRHDLFPFQERGHGWLRLLGDLRVGGILADDMGLGKTVQAIATLVSEREDAGEDVGPTLVVSPMSVSQQWAREIARFAPGLRVHLHHGPSRLTGDAFVATAGESDVVVTSYDVATRDVELLSRFEWDRLLLDEAQDAKNPRTKRHHALRRIPRRRALALTGTPIENRLGELWAIMDLVNPGLLGSREAFERSFARPIEVRRDALALERLRSLVGPFVLRRAKDAPEVDLELPPITIAKVRVQPDRRAGEPLPRHGRPLDAAHRAAREGVRQARGGPRDARAAEAAVQPPGARRPDRPRARRALGEARAARRAADARAGRRQGARVHPVSGLRPARPAPRGATRPVCRVLPRRPVRPGPRRARRALRVAAEPTVLVVSLRAGGRGLNLPAANHVVHFDRWWNPAVEQQATDRVHRLGQRKPVFVSSLVCTATVEERIDALLDAKRELADQVMAGRADDWLSELDLDAIRAAVALAPEAIGEAA